MSDSERLEIRLRRPTDLLELNRFTCSSGTDYTGRVESFVRRSTIPFEGTAHLGARWFLAWRGSQLLGAAAHERGGPLPLSTGPEEAAYLLVVAVADHAQKQGVGSALITHLLQDSALSYPDLRLAYALVDLDNEAGARLCHSHGLTTTVRHVVGHVTHIGWLPGA